MNPDPSLDELEELLRLAKRAKLAVSLLLTSIEGNAYFRHLMTSPSMGKLQGIRVSLSLSEARIMDAIRKCQQ